MDSARSASATARVGTGHSGHRLVEPEPGALLEQLSSGARAAWSESFMGCFPIRLADQLLVGAREVSLGPGSVFYRGAHHSETEKLGLVIDGLLRTYRRSADGRELTVRYASRARVIGLPAVLGNPAAIDGEAVMASRVLVLDPRQFRAITRREPLVAWEVAVYLADLVRETHDILAAHLFLPIRSRVAMHLLDLAVRDGERLVVEASQQDIADNIGSVREVVARAVAQLREEGYLERDDRRLVLIDPAGLHRISIGD